MEQELKNKFEPFVQKITGGYWKEALTPVINEALLGVYTLAKSEEVERIKGLEADIKYLKKEINKAGNVAMDLRYEIFAIQKEGSMVDKANEIVFTLSQVASDTTPKQNT